MSEQDVYVYMRLLKSTISSTAPGVEKESEILRCLGGSTCLSASNWYCDRLTLLSNVFLQNCDCNVFLPLFVLFLSFFFYSDGF